MNENKPNTDEVKSSKDTLSRRVLEVCSASGEFMEYWGFRAIYGRVWTVLALGREPMPQTEIAELLGVSRSNVSMSIAELTKYGLVRAIGEHRNAPYEAVMDVWPTISEVLRSREWMLVESVRTALEAAIDEAELATSKGVAHPYDIERMKLLLGMSEIAQSFLRILMRIRMPQNTAGVGRWVTRASKFIKNLGGFG
jgi:HTH-type transcriptional regulator, glycine betaine synthesis regulator